MDTLIDQKERQCEEITDDAFKNVVERISKLSEDSDLYFKTGCEVMKYLELKRKNDLFVANAAAFDEQFAGIGEILNEILGELRKIAELKEGSTDWDDDF